MVDNALREQIDRLREAVNDAARNARNVFLAYLVIAGYVAITVAATTDELLLQEGTISLPPLNLGTPVVGTYVVAPWLFILIHFNLVIQLRSLSRKLYRLDDSIQRLPLRVHREEEYHLLFPFPFIQVLIDPGERPALQWMINRLASLTIVFLPLGLLIIMQGRFLPYHSEAITTSHQVAVVVDLLLVLRGWPATLAHSGRARDWWGRPLFRGQSIKHRVLYLYETIGLGMVTLVSFTLSAAVIVVPGSGVDTWLASRAPVMMAAVNRSPTLLKPIIGETACVTDFERNCAKVFFHTNLRLAGSVLVRREPLPEVVARYAGQNIGEAPTATNASSRLGLVPLKFWKGLDLRGRNFQFADFREATLVNADFRGANLEHANFTLADVRGANFLDEARRDEPNLPRIASSIGLKRTILSGAKFRGANLENAIFDFVDAKALDFSPGQLTTTKFKSANLDESTFFFANLLGANFESASLQGAILTRAQLTKANLFKAQLEGAKLIEADLRDAILSRAQMRDTDLSKANLQRAFLTAAHLQEANLREANLREAKLQLAQLQGADLSMAQLQGAELREAQLQGADLEKAQLQGADLSEAQLQGADLGLAQLQGADLVKAQLQGADLRAAQLQGADLVKAQLQGADLRAAQLQGADLSGAQLQGADLGGAALQGADLSGAQLQGADLVWAGLWKVDFTNAKLDLTHMGAVRLLAVHQANRDELFKSLASSISDEKLLERVRERLRTRFEKDVPDNPLDRAPIPEMIIYEPQQPGDIPGWPMSLDEAEYYKKLAPFVIDLACDDEHVANGIARRIVLSLGSAPREEEAYATAVAEGLLADDCEARAKLSEDMKAWLRLITERAKQ